MIKKTIVSLCLISHCLHGNPEGLSVVSGETSLLETRNLLEVTVSDRAILDWHSFSIQAGETTRFIQPSIDSAVLNRVTGSEMSGLMGLLQANGQVFLVNPNGIVIGKEGRIDTAAFLATTLQIDPNDFTKGQEGWLKGESLASVINLGSIQTRNGAVSLIAHRVENSGEIESSQSKAFLISGHEILLNLPNQDLIYIRPDLPSDGVEMNGTIKALETNIETTGAFPLAINLSGTVEATQMVQEGGRIFLRAHDGDIRIRDSASLNAPEGTIIVHAEQGLSEVMGNLSATGGEVRVLGEIVAIADPGFIDVSSERDGGVVLLGGDYQGKNREIPNAKNVFIGKEARIYASSTRSGNGGKVISWGDESNIFLGQIDAMGGLESGDGGFVEISSPLGLIMKGNVSTLALHGKVGTLLLDPTNVCVVDNGGTDVDATYGGGTYTFSGNASTPCGFDGVVIDSGALGTQLIANAVTIDTSAATDQGETGNIVIQSTVGGPAANPLTLNADGNIDINATVQAGYLDATATGDISITGASIISSHVALGNSFSAGGDLNLTSTSITQRFGLTLSAGGMINFAGTNALINSTLAAVTFDINSNVGVTATTTIDSQNININFNNPVTSVGGAQSLSFTSTTSDSVLTFTDNIGTSADPFGALSFSLSNPVVLGNNGTDGSTLYGSSLTSTEMSLAADGNNPQGRNYFYITGPITFTGDILPTGAGALTIDTSPATTAPIDFTGIAIGNTSGGIPVDLLINNTDTTTGTTLNGTSMGLVSLSFTGTNANTDSIVTVTGSSSTINQDGFGPTSFGGPIRASTNFSIISPSSAISVAGPVTISADVTLTVTNNITFSGAFTSSGGARSFAISTADTAAFNASIGTSASPFSALTLTSSQTTLGGDIYASTSLAVACPIILSSNTSMNVTGPITLGNSITGGYNLGIYTTTSSLSLPATMGTVGTPLGSLTVSSTGSGTGTTLNGASIYAASVNFPSTDPASGGNGYVQLNGGAITINTSPSNGSVTFGGSIVGGQDLSVNSGTGDIQFSGPVSGGASNFSISGGSIGVAQNFTTTGGVGQGQITLTSSNNITLSDSVAMTISAGGNVPLSFTASNNITLGSSNTIQTDGNILFQGQVISASGAGTIQATGATATLTMVADAQNPTTIGSGYLSFPSGMTLCTTGCTGTGGALLLYTSHPSVGTYQNSFPSTINGVAYSSGSFTATGYTTGTHEFVGYYYSTIPPSFGSSPFGIIYKGIVFPLPSLPTDIQAALIPPDPTPSQTATQSLTATVQGVIAPNPKKACGVPSIAIGTP